MEKKQIILSTLRYENAPDIESQIPVELKEEKSLLRTDDRDIVLDLSKQFETERSNCKRYKFYGKIKMIFRNLYLGVSNYPYLRDRLALIGDGTNDPLWNGYLPYNEFAFLRTDLYRETTENKIVKDLNSFDGFTIKVSGTTDHQEVTSLNAPYHNWNFYLSHIYSGDTNYPMMYTLSGSTTPLSFVSGDGIPFRVETTINQYVLTSPVKHGISQGEYLIINSIPYYVNSVGNETYNSQYYVINIFRTQLNPPTLFDTTPLVVGKRCTSIADITNSTSEYYVHLHKVLTTPTDFSIDKVGFESPIWEDERELLFENFSGENNVLVERNRMESILFDLKNPFILSGITNNLGYTPTEMYVSVIYKNGDGYFNYPPKVGYSFHMHNSWVDKHFSGITSLENSITYTDFTRGVYTFSEGNTIPTGSTLHGAFVEYNPKEMKERIISESIHKIVAKWDGIFDHGQNLDSTYSGATNDNPIGMYYQPHYRFKLRELSPYTETSDTYKIDNLPENARYFPNEKLWRWRDLYDDGYIDSDGFGVDYPYMNDIHYIHNDINFYLRNEQKFKNKSDGLTYFDNFDKC